MLGLNKVIISFIWERPIGHFLVPKPLTQNEANCETFLAKISFISMRMRNHFHINYFACSIALIHRLRATRKWSITMGEALWDARARMSQERGEIMAHFTTETWTCSSCKNIINTLEGREGNRAVSASSLNLPPACFYYVIRHSVVFTYVFFLTNLTIYVFF